MDADQLRDLGRRAANHTGYRQILVLGSQAVHGSLPGVDLPQITTMSEEADLAVVTDLAGDAPHAIDGGDDCHDRDTDRFPRQHRDCGPAGPPGR